MTRSRSLKYNCQTTIMLYIVFFLGLLYIVLLATFRSTMSMLCINIAAHELELALNSIALLMLRQAKVRNQRYMKTHGDTQEPCFTCTTCDLGFVT